MTDKMRIVNYSPKRHGLAHLTACSLFMKWAKERFPDVEILNITPVESDLIAKLEKAKKALEFYADDSKWESVDVGGATRPVWYVTIVEQDKGKLAEKTLKELGE